MKRLMLFDAERRTLRDMMIFHAQPRSRIRARGILRLSQGLTLQEMADEFSVHLNGVEQWRQRWNTLGFAGLYEGHHTGRPRKWTRQQQQALRGSAHSEGGTITALLCHLKPDQLAGESTGQCECQSIKGEKPSFPVLPEMPPAQAQIVPPAQPPASSSSAARQIGFPPARGDEFVD
jgi:hypothetical protein